MRREDPYENLRPALIGPIRSDNLNYVRSRIPIATAVDAFCAKGRTPLSYAFEAGAWRVADYLLTEGADPDLPDGSGKVAEEYCCGSRLTNVLALLEAYYDRIEAQNLSVVSNLEDEDDEFSALFAPLEAQAVAVRRDSDAAYLARYKKENLVFQEPVRGDFGEAWSFEDLLDSDDSDDSDESKTFTGSEDETDVVRTEPVTFDIQGATYLECEPSDLSVHVSMISSRPDASDADLLHTLPPQRAMLSGRAPFSSKQRFQIRGRDRPVVLRVSSEVGGASSELEVPFILRRDPRENDGENARFRFENRRDRSLAFGRADTFDADALTASHGVQLLPDERGLVGRASDLMELDSEGISLRALEMFVSWQVRDIAYDTAWNMVLARLARLRRKMLR